MASRGGAPSRGGNGASGKAVSLGGRSTGGASSTTTGGRILANGGGVTSGGSSKGGTASGGKVASGGVATSGGGAPGAGALAGLPLAGAPGGAPVTGGAPTGGMHAGGTSVAGSAAMAGVPSGGVPPMAGTAGAGGNAAAGASVMGGCPTTGGPQMRRLALNLCIDTTEVTRAQYATWLATTTQATIDAQDSAVCGWNTSFAADTNCMSGAGACITNCDNHPQSCVDWCDATAFCKAIGKRLCGRVGGGPLAQGDFANADLDEWYIACSSRGQYAYPYGTSYLPDVCNGFESGLARTVPVASMTSCQSPNSDYAGVFDLSGNVLEWEDACIAGATAGLCRIRGGAYDQSSDGGYLSCGLWSANYILREAASSHIGFRCCAP